MNNTNEKFYNLICEYELNTLSIEILKSELKTGFEKLETLHCVQEKNLVSIIFMKKDETKIFKSQDFHEIPDYVSQFIKEEIIELTLVFQKPYLQRRNKIIKIK